MEDNELELLNDLVFIEWLGQHRIDWIKDTEASYQELNEEPLQFEVY